MNFKILNEEDIIHYKPEENKYNVLIRITDPEKTFTPIENRDLFTDVLELKFHDFTPTQIESLKKRNKETNHIKLFSKNDGKQIYEFFKKHKECDFMVFHCVVGVSRSAAVAVSWNQFIKKENEVLNIYNSGNYLPNPYVVDIMNCYIK